MTTITGKQSVSLTVATGPVLQYDDATFTTLTDDGVTPNAFVTLSVKDSTGGNVSYSFSHTTGAGNNMKIQPVGAWTLELSAGTSEGDVDIQGSSTSGTVQLQLASDGSLQWLDDGQWQSLPTTTLQASTVEIYNRTSGSSLKVTGKASIPANQTVKVGVAAPNAGNQKSLAMTVSAEGASHDPTFVIKSKTGGADER
jgi:hypothetical protein